MRPVAAVPVTSVTTRKGSRASASVGVERGGAAIGEAEAAAARRPAARRDRGRRGRDGARRRDRRPARRPSGGPACARRWRGASGRRGSATSRWARSVSSPPRPRSVSSTASSAAVPLILGAMDHVGEARMQREFRQRPALGGDPRRRHRAHRGCLSRATASAQAGVGGGSRKLSVAGIGDAPIGEIEHEAGEVGGEDFGRVERLERAGLALGPEPIGDAGGGAAGAAAALVGAGARHAAGVERGEAGRRDHRPARGGSRNRRRCGCPRW